MGDLPDEEPQFFQQFMVVITPEEPYESIAEKVLYYLTHDEERMRLTDTGYRLAHEGFTQEDYARKFMDAVEGFLHRHRGRKLAVWGRHPDQ